MTQLAEAVTGMKADISQKQQYKADRRRKAEEQESTHRYIQQVLREQVSTHGMHNMLHNQNFGATPGAHAADQQTTAPNSHPNTLQLGYNSNPPNKGAVL